MVCLKLLKKNILPAKVIEFLFNVIASIALLILNQTPDINEKYVLGKRLGKGSFGKVFLSKTPEEVLFANLRRIHLLQSKLVTLPFHHSWKLSLTGN